MVASRNVKKLAELRRVLDAAGVSGLELLSLTDVPEFDEAPETGATFEENALAKARDAYTATGLPAVADDSGLAVDALNGMPGVLSARWAGAHGDDVANLELLLGQLRDVPDERRGWSTGRPRAIAWWCAVSGRARSPGLRAVKAVSGTTRSLCRTVRRGRPPSCPRRKRMRRHTVAVR